MADRYYDLDASVASKKPIKAKACGIEWEFAAEPAAEDVLAYFALFRFGVLPVEKHREAYAAIIGAERVAELLDAKISWPQFDRLGQILLREYGIGRGSPAEPEALEESVTDGDGDDPTG